MNVRCWGNSRHVLEMQPLPLLTWLRERSSQKYPRDGSQPSRGQVAWDTDTFPRKARKVANVIVSPRCAGTKRDSISDSEGFFPELFQTNRKVARKRKDFRIWVRAFVRVGQAGPPSTVKELSKSKTARAATSLPGGGPLASQMDDGAPLSAAATCSA